MNSLPRQDPHPPSLLYIHMAALGDAVMASAALRLLKQRLPEWQIHVLARSPVVSYFQSLSSIAQVVPFVDDRFVDRRKPWKLLGATRATARLARQLRKNGYTAALQWRGQFPDTLMNACTGARHRLATIQSVHRPSPIPAERIRFLLTDLVEATSPDLHLVEVMAAPARYFLENVLGQIPNHTPLFLEYPLTGYDHQAANTFLSERGVVPAEPLACVSLSAKTTVNTWSADRFAAVADHLQARHGLRVVLTGLPAHREKEAEIAAKMKTAPLRSTGQLSFGGVCALLSRSQILLSLNTGISHIAAALRVPVVVLNGRDGASITPWGTRHRVVTRNSYYPRRHPNEREWAGLVPLISVAEVNDAVDALLCETHVASR